ncbi:MAG: ACP phosphodiesterase [Salinivirgaceae bacterium]|jgi:acyl carrier protein phosphodiesterase
MNILAHLYLSRSIDESMLGNFMGDFVKGNQLNLYPETIRQGIILHRQIDTITDRHDSHKQSRDRFREKYRLHSGIVVDIIYDHFLARQWESFHHEPLHDFAQKVYTYIKENAFILPKELREMAGFMIQNNWLELYKTTEGIERVLMGMARRTSVPNQVPFAMEVLKKDYTHLNNEFKNVFYTLNSTLNIDSDQTVIASNFGIQT